MEFLHPIVSSQVVDNSISYVSGQGVTSLFCAFTSDLGPDNVIKSITSPSEFIFHYGEPNMRKHGQAAYNVMNWLNSNGNVYALRVLPENAGFAHAVVNIQTKNLGTKNVLGADGTLKAMNDVSVRTVVAYSPLNNISVDALRTELNNVDREKTVDGYDNHWLFTVLPKGRGKAYNNLGFKLTLNTSYDDTYDFRVYNFEVLKTTNSGSVQVIEGPFSVSMDPDALSLNNESMFIKYVIEKYSKYFEILFNEDGYDVLGSKINPEYPNPRVLDFFNGVTRKVAGKTEKYLSGITGKEEDVHIALHQYDTVTGLRIDGEDNIVDTINNTEKNIVSLDNNFRQEYYADSLANITTMKQVLDRLILDAPVADTTNYTNLLNYFKGIVEFTADAVTAGELKLASDAFEADLLEFGTARDEYDLAVTVTETHTTNLSNAVVNVLEKGKALAKVLNKALKVIEAVEGLDLTLVAINEVEAILKSIEAYNILSIQKVSKQSRLTNAELALEISSLNSDKISAVEEAIRVSSEIIGYISGVELLDGDKADLARDTAILNYTAAVRSLNEANNVNLINATTSVNKAVTKANTMLANVKEAMTLTFNEMAIAKVENIEVMMDNTMSKVVNLAKTKLTTIADTSEESYLARVEFVTGNITLAEMSLVSEKALTYKLKLQSFDNTVMLSEGKDGDIEEGNPNRATATNDLLVKAYKGLIDTTLTNKKELPIDMIIDANYAPAVKQAIVQLCTEIRDDFIGLLDTGYTANYTQALDYRSSVLTVNSYMVSIFTQDFIVYDEFTGRDIKVTSPFYLSSKIPSVDVEFGSQYPFVGPRRGSISGYSKMSWNPTDTAKEELYKNQINYVEHTPSGTKFNSQLTSQTIVSALSDINNVRSLLKIKREIETMAEDYQFEFSDDDTLNSFQYNLNALLKTWVSNRACKSIVGTVYQSEYDKTQKIARVKVDIVFNSIIERILIDLVVGN